MCRSSGLVSAHALSCWSAQGEKKSVKKKRKKKKSSARKASDGSAAESDAESKVCSSQVAACDSWAMLHVEVHVPFGVLILALNALNFYVSFQEEEEENQRGR